MCAMGRIVGLGLLAAAALFAQEKQAPDKSREDLILLGDTATRTEAEWSALAQGLESKVARLLPCDMKVRAAIGEVSRASEVRLTALAQYLRAAEQKAKDNSAGARSLISNQEAFTAILNTERAEVAGERAAIEGQLLDLGESARQRTQLAETQKVLAGIAAMARQREARTLEQAERSATLAASLRDLDQSYQKEQAALAKELSALTTETAHWIEYYGARLERAQTECVITEAGAAKGPTSRGKKR
jgi:hypothetical protein